MKVKGYRKALPILLIEVIEATIVTEAAIAIMTEGTHSLIVMTASKTDMSEMIETNINQDEVLQENVKSVLGLDHLQTNAKMTLMTLVSTMTGEMMKRTEEEQKMKKMMRKIKGRVVIIEKMR
jgi:hypothetical protein